MSFERELTAWRARIDAALARYAAVRYPETLWEAMAYSLLAPGKRLRPLLCLAACEAESGAETDAMPFACALEMIHAYSLIHDDLPALDNDDLRRGRPTNHIVYGEALAVLAGDGLLNLAYETMAAFCCEDAAQAAKRADAMRIIAASAGAHGMVGGQTVDVLNENNVVDEATLRYIHENKTGRLFRAALSAGAAAAGADAVRIARYDALGAALGFAFQIQDDILDVTSTEAALGKPVGSDARNRKNTAVTLFGMDAARAQYAALCEEVNTAARELAGESFLTALLAYTAARLR